MGSFTGGGTRRLPLKPVKIGAALSGLALSGPRSLFFDCAAAAVDFDAAGRFGRTAEADILIPSNWQAGLLSKDTRRCRKTDPLGNVRE